MSRTFVIFIYISLKAKKEKSSAKSAQHCREGYFQFGQMSQNVKKNLKQIFFAIFPFQFHLILIENHVQVHVCCILI